MFRRVLALSKKEGLQIIRDPSSILIAFVLPLMLLVLFGYGISMDIKDLRVGVVLESDSPEASSLAAAFSGSRYFKVVKGRDRRELEALVRGGGLAALVVVPSDFDRRLKSGRDSFVQAIVCASEANTAELVLGYIEGAVGGWASGRAGNAGGSISVEPRVWFNEEMESRSALLPGSIAVIMTLIGTMLTSLVIAREWERGTMEALLATGLRPFELLLGKFVPYFVLGMAAMGLVSAATTLVMGVPFRGSIAALTLVSAVYLCAALGLGLLISTVSGSQFVATQVALILGYLPSFLLSGIVFEINSMPAPIRFITYCMPPRYFVSALQTLFLAGDVWGLLLPDVLRIAVFAALFLALTAVTTRRSLEG